ncbi:sporulation protein [Candidatus Dojkabacteria bacterium]|nr:sporulation protein [Candidatus Dojkabacteria bacterium]
MADSEQTTPETQEKKQSLWDKIKQWLGIGGVKLDVDMDQHLDFNMTEVKGQVILESKSDQTVNSVTVEMEDVFTYKVGDTYKTKKYPMGKVTVSDKPMKIAAGEQKALDFILPISFLKTSADEMKSHGGIGKALGSASAFMAGQKSSYNVVASATVEGTALGPTKVFTMKME